MPFRGAVFFLFFLAAGYCHKQPRRYVARMGSHFANLGQLDERTNAMRLPRYEEWAPTGFDTPGKGLGSTIDEDRAGWLVAPCILSRD